MRSRVHSTRDGVLIGNRCFIVGRVPLDEEFGGKRFAAHVLQAPLVRNVSGLAGSSGQIDPKDAAGKAVEAPRVGHSSPVCEVCQKATAGFVPFCVCFLSL